MHTTLPKTYKLFKSIILLASIMATLSSNAKSHTISANVTGINPSELTVTSANYEYLTISPRLPPGLLLIGTDISVVPDEGAHTEGLTLAHRFSHNLPLSFVSDTEVEVGREARRETPDIRTSRSDTYPRRQTSSVK